jgi:mRNA-degrading endonuclease RelE of RelBE toxin-antitoxin system
MNVRWTEGFIEDFSELENQIQQEITDKIEKLEKEGTKIEEVGLASNSETQVKCWKLKIKNQKTDHRAIFDIIKGDIVLIAVGHRDQIYNKKKWKKVAKRLRNQ